MLVSDKVQVNLFTHKGTCLFGLNPYRISHENSGQLNLKATFLKTALASTIGVAMPGGSANFYLWQPRANVPIRVGSFSNQSG